MDAPRLKYEMQKRGINAYQMSQKMGIGLSTFYSKCSGKAEFTLSEIVSIGNVLGSDTIAPIFFDGIRL